MLHILLDDLPTQMQSHERVVCLSLWFHINAFTEHVCFRVSPPRSLEQNVISSCFLHQHKELCLVSSTNCSMSSVLERMKVNIPFTYLSGFNMQNMKKTCTARNIGCNFLSTFTATFFNCSPLTVICNTVTQEWNVVLPSFFLPA